MSRYQTTITDDHGFAVQIIDLDTNAIVGESNDLDNLAEALDYVTRFHEAAEVDRITRFYATEES